jgi:catechol 2,3-dioxygenase-like lactoylglutathione lyase family enzyme
MNILGLDSLVFGVDDLSSCRQYLIDYGLKDLGGGRFEALDGTSIVIRDQDDASLPAGLGTSSMLRETVYGVADAASLDAIEAELRRDRKVTRHDGVVRCVDDMGFALAFQRSVRRPIALAAETVNAPGAEPQRGPNVLGLSPEMPALPRSLSHVVYFVPDAEKAEAFYARLGFVCTDRFTGVGPFLRPAGTLEHHALFLIQTPPGRHKFGSNWFWYFNSPLGCHVEYDADMDLHDNHWAARELPMGADNSQLFLFQHREKWAPGGPPPPGGAH